MSMLARATDGSVIDVRCTSDGGVRIASAPPLELRYNVGALAASAVYASPAIDLGPAEDRVHGLVLAVKNGEASTSETLAVESSDDGATWYPAVSADTQQLARDAASATGMVVKAVPMGRYTRVVYTNGLTAQTALKLYVTCLAR